MVNPGQRDGTHGGNDGEDVGVFTKEAIAFLKDLNGFRWNLGNIVRF